MRSRPGYSNRHLRNKDDSFLAPLFPVAHCVHFHITLPTCGGGQGGGWCKGTKGDTYSGFIGMHNLKQLPLPGVLSRCTLALCASATAFTMASPSPEPRTSPAEDE